MNPAQANKSAIVVGSGIIGIACAHYLSTAGMRVSVIDRGSIGGACSHANCGYICPSHVLPLTEPGAILTAIKSLFNPRAPFRVKPRFSPSLWNWLWQFARRCQHRQMLTAGHHLKSILDSSMSEYRRLMEEYAFDCEWEQNGLLYVLRTERGMRDFAKTDRLLSETFQIAARRIEGRDLPTFDPALKPNLAGAFHYENDASIRPDRLNADWSQRLKDRGTSFHEFCELLAIKTAGGQVTRLETTRGSMTADWYVIATGAWSATMAKQLTCRIPIQPGKGYSVTMERPSPCPQHPMLFPEHRVGVSPFKNGYRLGSMMEFAGFDTSIPDRRITQLRVSAEPYLVTPFTEGAQQTWYGWRPMTWDSLPVIGQVPKLSNAFLATGHNMLGVSLATATGKLVAEMIQGNTPHIDPSPYSPDRF